MIIKTPPRKSTKQRERKEEEGSGLTERYDDQQSRVRKNGKSCNAMGNGKAMKSIK